MHDIELAPESFPSIAEAFPPERPAAEDLMLPEAEGTTDSGTDTATCMATCLPSGMKFKWLTHFPQSHYSAAQGFVGQRTCYFQGSQAQLQIALRTICQSSWPPPVGAILPAGDSYQWWNDTVPVDVQCGAAGDERSIRVFGNIADADISNVLESYNEYRILVTYQLLHLSDPWPMTGKPSHPDGTSLTVQVRGGGETLMVDPVATTGAGPGLTGCFTGVEASAGFKDAVIARMRVPLTEYHLTCDRITDAQLCSIMSVLWKCREGTVNCDKFLNEDVGTLLFDTWTLDQTFIPDVDDPRRWRLGCVLKCRQVPGMFGAYPVACDELSYPIGWNHDYKRSSNPSAGTVALGWAFIMMRADDPQWTAKAAYTPYGSCPSPYVPRYQYVKFGSLFCSVSDSCTTGDSACVFGDCPDSDDCENQAPAPRRSKAIKATPRPSDDYPDIQQRVSMIVDEARKARARKVMRDNDRLASGEIDVWPEDAPPMKQIVPVTVLPGGKIVYPEGSR